MSLLTSSATSRDNQRFFLKMEREFMKRSFTNDNYSQPPHPLQLANNTTASAEHLITQQVDMFLNNMKNILSQTRNSRVDYYFLLNRLKSVDFFNEVAIILHQHLLAANAKLQQQVEGLQQQLARAQAQVRQADNKTSIQKSRPDSRFSGIKTVAENLWAKAKVMEEAEFAELCNKVILGEKVVIHKVRQGQSYKKWDEQKSERQKSTLFTKDQLGRIDNFLSKPPDTLSEQQQELAQLIEELKAGRCGQPCCAPRQPDRLPFSKASQLRKSSDARRSEHVYKNDKSQQYFNRYYRKSEFDIHKITNVEKTRMQEMEQLEDSHRVSLKKRKFYK